MNDVFLKPITRKLLLAKVEHWTQNKATARKTKQQLLRNKATDKQPQFSNDSPAAYSSKVASMPQPESAIERRDGLPSLRRSVSEPQITAVSCDFASAVLDTPFPTWSEGRGLQGACRHNGTRRPLKFKAVVFGKVVFGVCS